MKTFKVNDNYVIKANNLDEAERWLLNEHPEEYFGGVISEVEAPDFKRKISGDFLFIAVKEYYQEVFNMTDETKIIERLKEIKNNIIETKEVE